ncbi:hypothetical protein [Streptomyces sp. NPDC050546]|uniref:SbtR family transcriptional regulator n=1 Tax=Streptomyces sp. NPDC050546 TaxID=3365628 RepID=UPI0037B2387E
MHRPQLVAQARTALAEEPDPWSAFARFLRDALSAQGPGGPLLPVVGGRLPATDESMDAADRLRAALDDLVGGAHRAGVLRADFTSADIPILLEHLSARLPCAGERAAVFHLRYLDMVLAGLRSPGADRSSTLAGPAPHWTELRELWNAPEG